ncbi:MAG: hypothetical protein GEU99_07230 [Luteitalea sp.]|nr:hypothetical protein [Luteitalea sp.]
MTLNAIKSAMTRKGARATGVAAVGVLGLLVVATAAACRSSAEARALEASQTAAGPAGAPMLVSCQAGEHALIRQTVVNGQTASQVECVPTTAQSATSAVQPYAGTDPAAAYGAPPAAYQAWPPQSQPHVHAPSATTGLPPAVGTAEAARPAGAVPAVYEPVAQPEPEPRVVYERRPEGDRSKRSWQKSAVIIGSSAAIGAGVGGATGGKKGALIGTAVGGGGAAIWDALTRSR